MTRTSTLHLLAALAVAAFTRPAAAQSIDALLDAEQWSAAIVQLDRVIARAPTASALAQRGRAHRELGDYPRARADYDAALARDSTVGGIWLGRAATRLRASDARGAAGDVARARALGFDDPTVDLLDGMVHGELGDDPTAMAAFDRFVARVPAAPTGWYLRGLTHGRAARHDRAIADLTKAITLGMPGPDAYRLRATSHLALGDRSAACADGAVAAERGDADAARLVERHCR